MSIQDDTFVRNNWIDNRPAIYTGTKEVQEKNIYRGILKNLLVPLLIWECWCPNHLFRRRKMSKDTGKHPFITYLFSVFNFFSE